MDYTEIKPFLIGGIKVEEIVIECTGKVILSWLSRKGKCTMIETIYCTEVEGTIYHQPKSYNSMLLYIRDSKS